MARLNPQFEVRPSVITGDTADVYLHRTQRVLRNEGLNPTVDMEFFPIKPAVLAGALEVKALLGRVTSEGNREVWAVDEGQALGAGEVCLQIRAPYSSFGLYETAICGILAHQSGWATAAHDVVEAASGVPVVSVGAHNVHPAVAAVMDYAAVVGGCQACSTVLGSRLAGTQPVASVSGALLQLMGGDAEKALAAFDRAVAPDVPRIAYVDPRKEIVDQVVSIARTMKDKVDGVRVARMPGARMVVSEVVREVRTRLDEMGMQKVTIILSGELTPERVRQFVDEGAPIDVFHDSGYISSAPPIPVRANIRTVSDRPIAQETDAPAPNPRLTRLL